jgi:ATP/maltotriose-dependent transcriptional regulator MalT
LVTHRFIHVHGPRGIGKTCLVGELAAEEQATTPVLWYRFRSGVNDSLSTMLFELSEYARSQGRKQAALAFDTATAGMDVGLAGRLILRDLAELPLLLVLDDFHLAESDRRIAGWLEDAVPRLPSLRVITIGRHRDMPPGARANYLVPPMSRVETERLLAQAGLRSDPIISERIRRWTTGVPQLIKLAARWLATATDDEVKRGLSAFSELDDVQDFLLGSISELIATEDRAILDAASVFRQHFNDGAVAHVSQSSVGAVADTSARLVRAHIATRSRSGDVAFFHASIGDYFYRRLSAADRRRLHERAAEWYASHNDRAEATHHEQLAERSPGEATVSARAPRRATRPATASKRQR